MFRGWQVVFGAVCLLLSSTAFAQEDAGCACSGVLSDMEVDQLLACYSDPRCESDALDISVTLKIKSRFLADAIRSYIELSNNPLYTGISRQTILDQIELDKDRLKRIRKTLGLRVRDDLLEPLYLDFDAPSVDYHRYYYSFNLGYEYVSLNEIFQKGVPRLGFLLYRRYGDVPAMKTGFNNYGVHVMGSLQLTSSAEQGEFKDDPDNGVDNTLETSVEAFFPFYHSLLRSDARLSDYLGVLYHVGAKKNEHDDRVKARVYIGFRNSLNAETYTDFLIGRSQGVGGYRIEARGHIPVYKFVHGSRIFLGGAVNIGMPGQSNIDDKDVIRFYLEWNADFGKIIEGVSSAVGL